MLRIVGPYGSFYKLGVLLSGRYMSNATNVAGNTPATLAKPFDRVRVLGMLTQCARRKCICFALTLPNALQERAGPFPLIAPAWTGSKGHTRNEVPAMDPGVRSLFPMDTRFGSLFGLPRFSQKVPCSLDLARQAAGDCHRALRRGGPSESAALTKRDCWNPSLAVFW